MYRTPLTAAIDRAVLRILTSYSDRDGQGQINKGKGITKTTKFRECTTVHLRAHPTAADRLLGSPTLAAGKRKNLIRHILLSGIGIDQKKS